MPYTSKQKRFFQAVAHGMKPTKTKSKLTQGKAREILGKAKREGYAFGGAIGSVMKRAGQRDPLSVGPTSPRGALGSLGSTAKVGGIGDAARPRSGFAGRIGAARAKAGAALSGRPRVPLVSTSNLRPRPGRGVNAALALSGTPYHEAEDRLSQLRKRILPLKGSIT